MQARNLGRMTRHLKESYCPTKSYWHATSRDLCCHVMSWNRQPLWSASVSITKSYVDRLADEYRWLMCIEKLSQHGQCTDPITLDNKMWFQSPPAWHRKTPLTSVAHSCNLSCWPLWSSQAWAEAGVSVPICLSRFGHKTITQSCKQGQMHTLWIWSKCGQFL